MKKIYKRILFIFSLILIMLNMSFVYAQDNVDKGDSTVDLYINSQLEELGLEGIQNELENSVVLENIDLKTFIKQIIDGEKNLIDIFDKEAIQGFLFGELKDSLKIASIIIVLALLSSLLKSLDNSFSSGAITKIINYILFAVVMSVVLIGFREVLQVCIDTLDTTIGIIKIILPIMLGLLAINGLTITSTVMTPIFIGVVSFIELMFKDFIILTISVGFAIIVISNVSKNISLKKLSKFIKNINLVSVGAMFTVYLLVVSMQMLYIKSVDGFAMSGVKYAVGNFIPVVGGFLSDSINILMSSSHLIKSVFGSIGLVMLVGVCIVPIIKVISMIFVYKVCAVFVEPIGEESISDFLAEVSSLMTTILACTVAISFMFFVTVAVLTSISAVAPV